MEQERQDQLIQELINHLIHFRHFNAEFYRGKNDIPLEEWKKIMAILLEKGLIEKSGTVGYYDIISKADLLGGDQYFKLVQNAKKDEERKRKEVEKFDIDLKQARRQAKVFWPGFIIAVVGGLLGLATFILKVTEKQKTDVKYIGIDSKGHVIEFTVKKD